MRVGSLGRCLPPDPRHKRLVLTLVVASHRRLSLMLVVERYAFSRVGVRTARG